MAVLDYPGLSYFKGKYDSQVEGILNDIVADEYSSSATYAVGDYVLHDGKLYICKTAIATAEEWTAAHWTEVDISGEVKDLKSSFDSLSEMELNPLTLMTWEQGAFDKDYGTETVSTNNAIRSTNAIPSNVVKISCSADYKMNLWAWNGNTFIGHKATDGTFKIGSSYLFERDITIDWSTGYSYKITFYNTDNSTPILPSAGSNCITSVVTDNTLTLPNKIADAKASGDRINALETVVDELAFTFKTIDLDVYTLEHALITSGGTWNNRMEYSSKFVNVPDGAVSVNITANNANASIVALLQDSSHTDGDTPDYATGGSRVTINAGANQSFTIPTDCKYIWIWLGNNSTGNTPESIIFKIQNKFESETGSYIKESDSFAFVGTPTVIFENNDSSAISGIDDGLLNAVSVVKVSDSLFYMYYEAYADGESGYANARVCFAYSTDGENFTKGFPTGIEPPISGTNMILPKGTNHGLCVVKVPDSDYPFRMIATIGTDANRIAKMWKSADGINWSLLRQISNGYNDSFASCVVRGNLLKIFLRTRNDYGRAIGIITTDLDGNRHLQNWVGQISNENIKKQLYQASASILDDKREILLPTVYNPSDSTQELYCFILDGKNCKKIDIDTSSVMPSEIKSIYFASGIVNIGMKTYAYYTTRTTDHESSGDVTVSAIRRIEVTDTTFPSVVPE